MSATRLACFVGARPNLVKMAPLLREIEAVEGFHATLIHTGQHYDDALCDVFFRDLDMRQPDECLNVGSGTHGQQTAAVLERSEQALLRGAADGGMFDRVIVVGDVNSTLAAALTAAKLGIPVAHVEAGLRSFDRTMPEEINRRLTDAVADLLFVSEPAGVRNLLAEGHRAEQIHLCGNVMIDTLRRVLPRAQGANTPQRYGLRPGEYALVTLHRPSNVDAPETLEPLVDELVAISRELPLAFPVHPRTQARLESFGLDARLSVAKHVIPLPPLGYVEFLSLSSQAKMILTDSGGLQEESTALGIPCLTLRENTERPITVEQGTSTLVGNDPEKIRTHFRQVTDGRYKSGECPHLWDGQAACRIVGVLAAVHRRG